MVLKGTCKKSKIWDFLPLSKGGVLLLCWLNTSLSVWRRLIMGVGHSFKIQRHINWKNHRTGHKSHIYNQIFKVQLMFVAEYFCCGLMLISDSECFRRRNFNSQKQKPYERIKYAFLIRVSLDSFLANYLLCFNIHWAHANKARYRCN